MKTVQGGLLVLIGLGILWLAVTGRLDKLGEAWGHVVQGEPLPSATPRPSGSVAPAVVSSFSTRLPPVLARAYA